MDPIWVIYTLLKPDHNVLICCQNFVSYEFHHLFVRVYHRPDFLSRST